jgi:hypothetical protein
MRDTRLDQVYGLAMDAMRLVAEITNEGGHSKINVSGLDLLRSILRNAILQASELRTPEGPPFGGLGKGGPW